MKFLSVGVHGALDYVTVLIFAVAPWALGLVGPAAWLAWALAIVHLAMTLMTSFEPGRGGVIPLSIHAAVELGVGVALVALPFLAGWVGTARNFYLVMGAVILVVWAGTRYRAVEV